MPRNASNAIIMAAGTASRFVPLSFEIPKGLLEVKGEVLIERQIRQLMEAGVRDITVVTGYKAEMFEYLENKLGVRLVYNEDYFRYNNVSSIMRVLDKLSDTFICSSDNYFPNNIFREKRSDSYYSAKFSDGVTDEYCFDLDDSDIICDVKVGGNGEWYMIGPAFFSKEFSDRFKTILSEEYTQERTRHEYWEDVFIRHINVLPPMKIKRHADNDIEEFDSLDDLRGFDSSYINNTRSTVIKKIAVKLECRESDMSEFKNIPHPEDSLLFSFRFKDRFYRYEGSTGLIYDL